VAEKRKYAEGWLRRSVLVKRNYHEPLLQTLETELGGTVIFATALKAAKHQELQSEFKRFLDETGRHLEIT
jgi:hypothetical protein